MNESIYVKLWNAWFGLVAVRAWLLLLLLGAGEFRIVCDYINFQHKIIVFRFQA